jgi:hypothetical protein
MKYPLTHFKDLRLPVSSVGYYTLRLLSALIPFDF